MKNLAPINDDQDKVTKKYVDDAVDVKFDKAGGTIAGDVGVTGQVDVGGDIYSNGEKVSTYQPLDYSTSEQNTGQKWIDGKNIFKKTILCIGLPNNTEKSFAHGVSGIEGIIGIEGATFVTNSGVYDALLINSLRPTYIAGSIGAYFDSSNITISAGANRSDRSAYITIYYTKV